MKPRVSTVIATYKRPEALLRAVRSVLAQTVAEIELIIVVECDDSASREALATIADPRVSTVVNPIKAGPGPARDTGAAAATAPYIAFLDDDDEWLPAKLERQLTVADERTIVMTLTHVLTMQGSFVRPGRPYEGDMPIDEWLFDRRSWLRGGDSMLQTSSLLMPRALFATLGFGCVRHEEWELVIRAVKQHGYRLVTLREPLTIYRAGGHYPWRPSLDWVHSVTDLLTPRAAAGFCLQVATQGLVGPERNKAFAALFRAGFALGRPTLKQLFAYVVIWGVPHDLRWRLRAALKGKARDTPL